MDQQKKRTIAAVVLAVSITSVVFLPVWTTIPFNLLVHLANVALAFWLIYLLTGKTEASFITALLFGVHPLRVDSVVWLVNHKDVLYAFFYLGSLISYVFSLQRQNMHRLYLILSFILFVPAVLAKTYALTLPLSILLIDYYWGRGFTKHPFLEKIPFFFISVIWAAVALLTHHHILYPETLRPPTFQWIERAVVIHYNLLTYLIQHFAPIKLSVLYPYPEHIRSVLPLIYYACPPTVWLIAIWVFRTRRYTRNILFAALFFLIHIFLILKTEPEFIERYTYLASIGIFFLIGQTYSFLFSKPTPGVAKRKLVVLVILMAYISQLAFITIQRCLVLQKNLSRPQIQAEKTLVQQPRPNSDTVQHSI